MHGVCTISTKTLTTIASGFERGDYAMTDPSNGTLLLDESTGIWRLGLAGGCFGPSCSVPEPASLWLFAGALIGLGFVRRRRRARTV